MKKLNLIFAILVFVFFFNACSPDEEVKPQAKQPKQERFDAPDTDDGYVKPGGK